MGPLGILGGTFDPIHNAHLRLAIEARDALGLARLRLIPAGSPPHRAAPRASAAHRLAMLRCALAEMDSPADFEVDVSEVESSALSYTVDTLQRLRAELGAARPLVLIMGADAFQGLARWHRWQDLFALAHIGVATRPGYDLAPASLPDELAAVWAARLCASPQNLREAAAGLVLSFPITPMAISASAIRAAFQHDQCPRFLLPKSVVDYIDQHHLYKN